MNARWKRATGLVAGAMWLAAGLVTTVWAAPKGSAERAPTASRSGAEPLTRRDVDKMLEQARTAIAAGNLDQAQALVERSEGAHVRYPLFHMGATPSSVRRELSDAQIARRGVMDAAGISSENRPAATKVNPTSRVAAPTDPFTERSLALPSAPTSQPAPPSMGGGMPSPVVPALHEQLNGVNDRQVVAAAASAAIDEGPAIYDAPLPSLSAPGQAQSQAASDYSSPGHQKAQVLQVLRDARVSLEAGDFDQADELAHQAIAMGVPESMFLPQEDRPSAVAWEIQRARSGEPVGPSVRTPPTGEDRYASRTQIAPERDTIQNSYAALPTNPSSLRFAEAPEPLDLPNDDSTGARGSNFDQPVEELPPTRSIMTPANRAADIRTQKPLSQPVAVQNEAVQLLEAGEVALRKHDRKAAAELFGQAFALQGQLAPADQERLREHMQMLAAANASDAVAKKPQPLSSDLIDSAKDSDQVLARQMSAEVGKKQSEARHARETDPQHALKLLKDARQQVNDSKLAEEYRNQLVRRIDITLDETEKYIADHKSEIEIDQQNKAVMDEVNRNREVKVKVQQKVAELVDEFNKLRDEQRYAEMEVVARRLIELAPDEEVAKQVWQNAKFIRRTIMNGQLADRKEESIWSALNDVENSAVQNVGDGHEVVYDQKKWDGLIKNRKPGDRDNRRTEREIEIERRLKTPVLLRYEETPLSEVVRGMSELSGVNIHLDSRGLNQEGVSSDTPVTINLNKEISLKSALNLILEPLHLSYVVKDEVLKVTSQQLRDGEIYPVTYNVADLVVPIPNFVPNSNIGLQGLINDAHASMGYGPGAVGAPGPSVLVNGRGEHGQGAANSNVLAQQFGGAAANTNTNPSMPIGSGPGGMGAGAEADFDSLIDLIVSTIASESWAENGGGEAEIRPFPTNLSLVISQTQAVHEEIADLLTQLRRLQDLQVTIEVRFIRLNDSFFERIGVDFQMNIEDRSIGTADLTPGAVYEPRRQSAIVGLQQAVTPTNPFPNFTSDLDVPFRQGSFNLTQPPFGGPSVADYGRFGFAILSDIEAFFLIEAMQGDRRTNILNAPKVTLFNGQQAFVADATSRPFVIGVIPVVGEFAAAQQPVIVVLNEGTLMTIQAVVSNDRRYVRLTVVPFFTQVGDVQEFTFEGTSSSTSSSSSTDNDEDGKNESNDTTSGNNRTGVTVQLPSFQFVAVVTTVSVPDGGTVLLGGIKRLSEGRNEFGIPLLSKVPYINRLFKNVGIGRTTDSLMMMVTPRIIIQEEEEERLGITANAP